MKAKKIQIANIERNKAKIEDDVWRNHILPRFGAVPDANGRVSLNSVPESRLDDLIRELRNKSAAKTDWRAPRIAKIKAMWEILFSADIVRNREAKAMRAWCAKMAGVERLEWASARKLDDCIEGLKKMATRGGLKIVYDADRHTFLVKGAL
jgi:hypothetical protein